MRPLPILPNTICAVTYTQLRLAPFGKAEAEEFLTAVLGDEVEATDRSSRQALKRLILEKTEGTPFFMEEVVQTLAEEGVLVGDRGHYRLTHHAPTLHIPPTVQGVLTARIDRLTQDEKALLQQLAVIGREFPLSLVRHIVSLPEDELYRVLASLQHKEFLYEQPAFPEVEYLFKHALTQEVAYNSLLLERRKALHEQTARALEMLYHARLEEHYSELAHHYTRSGNTEKAIDYLQLAGEQAVQRAAFAEAVTQLTTALQLLTTLPETADRARRELSAQLALGPPLIATKGFGAPEVEHAYTRACDLCQQVGETPQLFPTLWGLWAFHVSRAEYKQAQALAEQGLFLAQSVQDPALLLEAHRMVRETLWGLGEFATARQHFADGIALYDPHQHHSLAAVYGGEDPGIICRCMVAFPLWLCGYPDRALQSIHVALALAQELSHSHSLAGALHSAAALHQLRREERAVQERADAALTLSTDQGFPMWVAMETILRGWAVAVQGHEVDGIAQMRQGLAAYRATGTEEMRSYLLAFLAEAYGKEGQPEEGLNVLAEALVFVRDTGECGWEAELYRLKGELTLQEANQKSKGKSQKSKIETNPQPLTPDPHTEAEAEACFRKAIEVARRQSAKSWELRAATSLARLWQQQGKKAEAHQLLADIYRWFTEGFDTKDLQEAKALLEELH
jgi:predicted ATPase